MVLYSACRSLFFSPLLFPSPILFRLVSLAYIARMCHKKKGKMKKLPDYLDILDLIFIESRIGRFYEPLHSAHQTHHFSVPRIHVSFTFHVPFSQLPLFTTANKKIFARFLVNCCQKFGNRLHRSLLILFIKLFHINLVIIFVMFYVSVLSLLTTK